MGIEWTKERLGLVSAAAALVAAFVILLVMDWVAGAVDGAAFIAILLFPVIVYAVMSGRVAEFSGPGGWGAKFRDAATSTVETDTIDENVEDLQPVMKGGRAQLEAIVQRLNPNLPNALTLRIGRAGYYTAEAIRSYLKALIASGPSTHVIFVSDATGGFIGSAGATQVLAILESDAEVANDFVSDVSYGNVDGLRSLGFLVTASLKPGESNTDALKKFLETNVQALVVVSGDGRTPLGVVDKDRLITKLMVKLAGDS